MRIAKKGDERTRTAVRGFAGLCLATRPRRHVHIVSPANVSILVTPHRTLIHEKLDQAVGILRERDVDLWLTLARETLLTKDPALDLIAGTYCAWQSAFLVAQSGERIAIVGRFDAPNLRDQGAYTEVVGYDESIAPHLREAVERLDPRSIALNYSTSDAAADGLTHGLWLVLSETLAGTAYADRLVSSEAIVNALRGRKSAEEVRRIRAAVSDTEEIFEHVTRALAPGQSELEIAALMRAEVERRGLGYAWGEDHCPAVNAGPEKDVGHSAPGELRIERGHLLHVDFGVTRDEYASDLQRVWYVPEDSETDPPAEVLRAWSALWAAMAAGAEALHPGAVGWEVDAAARQTLVDAGFPEPMYALGHQLGRAAHDGGSLLGPRWDRYGAAPFGIVEEGNVFTLEYGTAVPGRGYIGLEEDVLVTADGVEWLSTPQRELWLVG
jgi:Xaa-Pro aminopeptidase